LSPTNNRQGCKGSLRTNALAYLPVSSAIKKKSFITWTHGISVMKRLFFVTHKQQTWLQRFLMDKCSSLFCRRIGNKEKELHNMDTEHQCQNFFSSSPTDNRQGHKGFWCTNALAYLPIASEIRKKRFLNLTCGISVITFFFVTHKQQTRL
jgi:Cofactor of BRCA1 (COBRA1)